MIIFTQKYDTKMKNIKFLLILNLIGSLGFVVAQNTISIEDIYKNNTFKAEFVTSGNAMRDGDHFTTTCILK